MIQSDSYVQKEINKILFEHFIERMLIYYDPWGLIATGAPYDEYNSFKGKIISYLQKDRIHQEDLAKFFLDLFQQEAENYPELPRKTNRMAEDIIYLLNSP
jgi:hypothetical protein